MTTKVRDMTIPPRPSDAPSQAPFEMPAGSPFVPISPNNPHVECCKGVTFPLGGCPSATRRRNLRLTSGFARGDRADHLQGFMPERPSKRTRASQNP